VRRVLSCPAVPTRAEIDVELVRCGIEENPGPPKKQLQIKVQRHPKAPDMSPQEKREACREPLSKDAEEMIRRKFVLGGKAPTASKAEFQAAVKAEKKEEEQTAHELDLLDAALLFGVEEADLPPPEPSCTSSTSAAKAEPTGLIATAAADSVDPIPDEEFLDPDEALLQAPDAPPQQAPKKSSLQQAIDSSKVRKSVRSPSSRHQIADDAIPPTPPPAPDTAVFQDGDLRGDVLLKGANRDERIEFAKSLFGPHVHLIDATIERYVPGAEARKATNRNVAIINKPFEVRHLKVRVGPSKLGAIFAYSIVAAQFVLGILTATYVPYVGDFLAFILMSSALFYYNNLMSEPHSKSFKRLMLSYAIKCIVHALPHTIPHYTLLRILAPQLVFLTLPLVPKGMRTISYMPHLVSCLLGEYKQGTTRQVMEATLHQKTMRMASLPLPDRATKWTATDLEVGSE